MQRDLRAKHTRNVERIFIGWNQQEEQRDGEKTSIENWV